MKGMIKSGLVVTCFFLAMGIIGTLLNFSLVAKSGMSIRDLYNEKIFLEEEVTILESSLEKLDGGLVKISGIAENNLGRDLDYLKVVIKVYDNQKNLLESLRDEVFNLAARERWKFSVTYDNLEGYEIGRYEIIVEEFQ